MAIQSLLAKIGVDTKAFNSGLKGAEKRVGMFRGAITKLGAAIAGIGFIAMARNAINTGSRISDLSEQLRINAEALQTLNAIAIKAGVEQKTLERAIRNVSIRTQEAVDGNKTYLEAFERLGISIKNFTNLPTEKKLEAIAQSYSRAGKSQEAFADIANILGQKAGPEMLEVLRRINDEGLDNLIQGAKDTGQVMENDVIKTMDDAADVLGRLGNALTVASANILSNFAPSIIKLTDFVTNNSKQVLIWTRRLASFVIGIKAAAVVLPLLTGAVKAYTIGARGAALITSVLSVALTTLKLKIQMLLGATGIGLLFVGVTEVASRMIIWKDKTEDLNTTLDDASESTYDAAAEIENMNAQLEAALSGADSFNDSLNKLTTAEEDATKASKDRADALKAEAKAQEELTREVEDQFFKEKELQLLRLKAAGKNKEAEALEKQIALTREANELMKKFNITKEEAIQITKALEAERNKENETTEEGTKTEAKAQEQSKSSTLTGHALKKAANVAGKDKNIRFEKMGDGTFQQFVNGKKGEKFTEAQLQKGLGNQIDKDDTGSLLEKINKTLEGKFVSQ